jgi:hypothetical protein
MPSRHSGFVTSPLEFALEADGAVFLAAYNGAWGHHAGCSKAQWALIRPSFLEAMAPVSHYAPKGIRNYAAPYVRLAAWALEQGLALEPAVLLSAEVSEAFLAGQEEGTADSRSWLRRLARAHGIGVADTPVGYHWRPAPAPYSDEECAALVGYARSLTNEFRRTGLSALLALGLGCGLARRSLRGVTAAHLHYHDRDVFMRSATHCAKVRSPYATLLEEVCHARPEGTLVGSRTKNITTEIVSWGNGRVGVPPLSPDRLRSTYICRSIEEGAPFLDLVAWTGVKTLESIAKYLDYIRLPARTCPEASVTQGGAK